MGINDRRRVSRVYPRASLRATYRSGSSSSFGPPRSILGICHFFPAPARCLARSLHTYDAALLVRNQQAARVICSVRSQFCFVRISLVSTAAANPVEPTQRPLAAQLNFLAAYLGLRPQADQSTVGRVGSSPLAWMRSVDPDGASGPRSWISERVDKAERYGYTRACLKSDRTRLRSIWQ